MTPGIPRVELLLTGRPCFASGRDARSGLMTLADWTAAVDDMTVLGIPEVRFGGDDPAHSPDLVPLLRHALRLGLTAEVHTVRANVPPHLWHWLAIDGARLSLTYYSDDPAEHDGITREPGSHGRALATIVRALDLGVPLRVTLVRTSEEQRIAGAVAELTALGVTDLRVERPRRASRAAVQRLCSRCYYDHATIDPNGDLHGCALSRPFPTGNVRFERLAATVGNYRPAGDSARTTDRTNRAAR
ncbi:radical SAM protein [Streptomyces sp. RFCAC02]|uniref:radical SAM protein n=1 Tax=Streptomyces sp. RFCAC02 TaxID=2499143 RepID=UPI00101F1140|nr:radical SAM protein [Streptomyces sp. RFCAC02]